MRCNGSQLRFSNKNYNKTYASLINKWTKELVSLYGTRVDYYVYNYKLGRQDAIYGEDPAANYSEPVSMVVYAKVNSDSLMLSKFGLQNTAELEVFIPFDVFGQAFGPHAYPKSGDLIRLTEAGLDRPGGGGYPYVYGFCPSGDDGSGSCLESISADNNCNFITGSALDLLSCCMKTSNSSSEENETCEDINPMSGWLRGPKIYEITSVEDDNISQQLNPMMTHTVWNIKAVRFDNSYQPNAPIEHGSNMVNDSPYYGKLPGGTDTPENPKLYPQTAEKENSKYWNYDEYKLDTIYGGYGTTPKDEIPDIVDYNPINDPWSDAYYEVFSSINFYDLNKLEKGEQVFYKIYFDNNKINIEQSDSSLINPNTSILLKDTSPCNSEYKIRIYALYLYNETLSISFIGGLGETNGENVYSSLLLSDKDNPPIKIYIHNGELFYGRDDIDPQPIN